MFSPLAGDAPRSARRSRTRGAACGAALALILTLGACAGEPEAKAPEPARVDVMVMQPRDLPRDMDFSGRTRAYRVAEIRPQVNGILQRRFFTEGVDVAKGQTLYQIDPSVYQATYNRAVANLASARNLARRYEDLVADKVVSRQQRDDAVAAWHQAEAEVQAAHIDLQRTHLSSPITGRIGRSLTTEGALVSADQAVALTTVTQLDPIFVDIQQSSDELLRLRRHLTDKNLTAGSGANIPVELTLEDGKPYEIKGKLSFSEVNVDPGTGMTTLRAIFPNPEHLLLPGMYVRAKVRASVAHSAFLVPQNAVSRDIHADPFVYVVAKDGSAKEARVTLDGSSGNSWIVTQGLHAGDRVITNGLEAVRPGAQVAVEEVSGGAAAKRVARAETH